MPSSSTSGHDPFCPECGPIPQSPIAISRLTRWPVRLGWIIALLLAAIVTVQSWLAARWHFVQRTDVGKCGRARWIGEGVTRDQLEQIARGGGDGRLVQTLADLAREPTWHNVADPVQFYVTLAPPRGTVTHAETWGWPFVVFWSWSDSGFEDVFHQTGPFRSGSVSGVEDGPGEWWWWWSSFGGRKMGTVGTTWYGQQFELLAIAANLVVAVVLWRFAWWACLLVSRRRSKVWLRGRMNRALALFAGGCVAIFSAIGQTFPSENFDKFASYRVDDLDRNRLMTGAPSEEATIASLILKSCPEQDGFLAVSFGESVQADVSMANYGWPLLLFNAYTYARVDIDDQGNTSRQLAHLPPLRKCDGSFSITLGHWAGAQRRTIIHLHSTLFAELGLLWLIASLTQHTSRFAIRRRATRRLNSGKCVACGYLLAPSRSRC